MFGSAAMNMVMQRIGNRTDPDLRASLANEMALVQGTTLEQGPFKPWFLNKLGTLLTVAQTAEVALPADFLAFDEEIGYVALLDPNRGTAPDLYRKLRRTDQDRTREWFYDSDYGMPKAWWLVGTNITLRPVPDAEYSLQLQYLAAEPAVSDADEENLWLKYAPDLLIAWTSWIGATQYLQNSALADSMQAMIKQATDRLLVKHTEMMESARERIMNEGGY